MAIISLDITQVFQDKWPELTFYLVLIAITSIVVWRISAFYYKHIKAVENKVKHSDCTRHSTAIDGFDEVVKTILRKIDFVERALIAKDPGMLVTFSQSNSPRQLNQRAIELMADSGADKILEKHRDDLVKQIEEMSPATAYDVEQNAYKILILNSDESWFSPLKEFIFNSPVYQGHSISVDVMCFVMSLPLRNYYFDKHPEID